MANLDFAPRKNRSPKKKKEVVTRKIREIERKKCFKSSNLQKKCLHLNFAVKLSIGLCLVRSNNMRTSIGKRNFQGKN